MDASGILRTPADSGSRRGARPRGATAVAAGETIKSAADVLATLLATSKAEIAGIVDDVSAFMLFRAADSRRAVIRAPQPRASTAETCWFAARQPRRGGYWTSLRPGRPGRTARAPFPSRLQHQQRGAKGQPRSVDQADERETRMRAATPPLASDTHVVGFYRDDQELIDQVAEYLIEGVTVGSPALVVMTAAHRREVQEWLAVRGIDSVSMGAGGTVRFVDAAETLSQFMVAGAPDPDRFALVVGALIHKAGSGRVRVCGEMVQLLWESGNVNAAMQLESLWNELAAGDCDRSLCCAYRSDTVSADPGAWEAVCRLHSALVGLPPDVPADAVHADNTATAELVPSSDAPSRARRLVAEALRQWRWTGDHQAALLIVNELAANAVVHARSPLRVCITCRGDLVRISVADLHPGGPLLAGPSPRQTSGRGLEIVAALADRWSHDVDGRGKQVWAEIHSGQDLV